MRRTVLIVDDHASFRRLSRRLFEEAGFDVVGEAVDGRSAFEEAERLSPDLVLLDVVLPDMSGFEVTRMLEALPTPMAVLLVSSRSAHDLGVEGDIRRRFLRKDELSLERLRQIFASDRE